MTNYTKEDLLDLQKYLNKHRNVTACLTIIHAINLPTSTTDEDTWVKERMAKLRSEYPWAVGFLTIPFKQIPLVITRFTETKGIAIILMKWRLEHGK